MSKLCKNCGYTNADYAKFCVRCGARLDEEAAPLSAAVGGTDEGTEEGKELTVPEGGRSADVRGEMRPAPDASENLPEGAEKKPEDMAEKAPEGAEPPREERKVRAEWNGSDCPPRLRRRKAVRFLGSGAAAFHYRERYPLLSLSVAVSLRGAFGGTEGLCPSPDGGDGTARPRPFGVQEKGAVYPGVCGADAGFLVRHRRVALSARRHSGVRGGEAAVPRGEKDERPAFVGDGDRLRGQRARTGVFHSDDLTAPRGRTTA